MASARKMKKVSETRGGDGGVNAVEKVTDTAEARPTDLLRGREATGTGGIVGVHLVRRSGCHYEQKMECSPERCPEV